MTGEVFEPEYLSRLLYCPLDGRDEDAGTRQPILLYPNMPVLPQAPAIAPGTLHAENFRLIILDGTWRKSRKMLHANPLLQTLPRLSLENMPASRYLIRRAHGPDQRSTLEAACHALAALENTEDKYRPLLESFDRFIALQEQWFRR